MTSELAKTIATCAIWAALATILTFGLFRMNGSTEFFVITTFILACAAGGSTVAVWLAHGAAATPPVAATRPEESNGGSPRPRPTAEEHGITRKSGT